MASAQDKPGDTATGFAGLSLLVSDVDSLLTNARIGRPEPPAVVTSFERTQPTPQPARDSRSRPEQYQQAGQRTYTISSSDRKLLVAIGGALFLVWLLYQIVDREGTVPAPPSFPQTSGTTAPSAQSNEAFDQYLARHAPSRPSEDKPPVSTGLILGAAQIRYCLAETIRLGSAREVLNNTIELDVARFNEMVDDYNSRCGEYRYRRGALESARSEVERFRSLFESEGHNRFNVPSVGPMPGPIKHSRPRPDRTVPREPGGVNELRHDADPGDVLKGARTRPAIPGSQRDEGLLSSGEVNSSSLEQLNSASPSSSSTSKRQDNLDLSGHPTQGLAKEGMSDTANLQKCLDGRYPALCNHLILTPSEAVQVEGAERRANLETCLNGRYASLCNHSLLTSDETDGVKKAELKANLEQCLDGRYPSLCNHSLLTPDQTARVIEMESRAARGN